MKKNMFYILMISTIISLTYASYPQEKDKSEFGITFNGYVRTDFFYDTRQTVSLREGHFLLYPANELLDKNGEDVNAKINFNLLSIQTRLTGKITGPEFLGAKTSGTIEAEFFGTSETDVNGFRLRHAFVNMKWASTSLLVGQTWHPLFIADMFPNVVSFNTGVPFLPFARCPQVKLTQSLGSVNLIAVVAGQRDFTSNGPSGFSSSYLRNSGLPDLHFQLQYKSDNLLFGAGVDYKILQPRVVTIKNIKTDETIGGLTSIAYLKIKASPVTFSLQGIYGQNATDLMMLGGYAVKAIDSTTGKEEYTNLNSYSIWSEIYFGNELQFGLFGGYTKNLGSSDNIVGAPYTRVSNIDNIMRIAPRVQLTSGSTRFALELEYTSAGYGTLDKNGKVTNPKNINNVRTLLAVNYYF